MVLNFRTGDILIWRSTTWGDLARRYCAAMGDCHSSLIFKGEKYVEYSRCGPSPSHTYATFNVDEFYPIEEIIGKIWIRGNGCELSWIRRKGKRNICFHQGSHVIQTWNKYQNHPLSEVARVCLAGYFEMGQKLCRNGCRGRKYRYCSSFVGYCLQKFRFIPKSTEINNLFPENFYHLDFEATCSYERVCIFNKQNFGLTWAFTGALISKGILPKVKLRSKLVDQLLKDYDWPRTGTDPELPIFESKKEKKKEEKKEEKEEKATKEEKEEIPIHQKD